MCVPSSELGLPHPSLASECAPPPEPQGGGAAHSLAREGLGESQFRRLRRAYHSAYSSIPWSNDFNVLHRLTVLEFYNNPWGLETEKE